MPNIKQIQSVDTINEALDSGFYQTIDDCFSVPPFSEIITREKVNYYFYKYVNQCFTTYLKTINPKTSVFLRKPEIIELQISLTLRIDKSLDLRIK